MVARTAIINLAGNHEESVERLAKWLGTDKLRRKMFNTVYGKGSLPRSKKQIMAAAGIKPKDTQQAQNQIDHLATHHLVVREDNNGAVKDGSRYLYKKDENIRAIRKELIRLADDKKTRDKLTTMRRPAVKVAAAPLRIIKRSALKKKKRVGVLYLTADADRHHRLRVDTEMRRVKEEIRSSAFRDNVTVEYAPAAGLNSLLNGLNDGRPQIVHFSGHGNKGGIAMDAGTIGPANESLSFSLLAKALGATDTRPAVVVLNSCDSAGARKSLLKLGVIVVSMKTSISDIAAITFAPRFYAAIASGQSVKSAFEQAKVAVEMASISEKNTPQLFCPPNLNPAKITLA